MQWHNLLKSSLLCIVYRHTSISRPMSLDLFMNSWIIKLRVPIIHPYPNQTGLPMNTGWLIIAKLKVDGAVDSKVPRSGRSFTLSIFLIKRQNDEYNANNSRWFLFGVTPDAPAFKARVFTSVLNFKLESIITTLVVEIRTQILLTLFYFHCLTNFAKISVVYKL